MVERGFLELEIFDWPVSAKSDRVAEEIGRLLRRTSYRIRPCLGNGAYMQVRWRTGLSYLCN